MTDPCKECASWSDGCTIEGEFTACPVRTKWQAQRLARLEQAAAEVRDTLRQVGDQAELWQVLPNLGGLLYRLVAKLDEALGEAGVGQ